MTIRNYIIGYILSLVLTALSFGLVWEHIASHHSFISHNALFNWTISLALVQLVVQLYFFLHIGRDSRPRDIVALVFAVSVVVLIIGGSLWIMSSLTHAEPTNPNSVLFPDGVSPQNQND